MLKELNLTPLGFDKEVFSRYCDVLVKSVKVENTCMELLFTDNVRCTVSVYTKRPLYFISKYNTFYYI